MKNPLDKSKEVFKLKSLLQQILQSACTPKGDFRKREPNLITAINTSALFKRDTTLTDNLVDFRFRNGALLPGKVNQGHLPSIDAASEEVQFRLLAQFGEFGIYVLLPLQLRFQSIQALQGVGFAHDAAGTLEVEVKNIRDFSGC